MAPRQLLYFYLTLVLLSCAIGFGFAAVGAWMVLPFSGVEMLAVGIALFVYARHSTDQEKVVLSYGADRVSNSGTDCEPEGKLTVEAVVGGRRTVTSLNPHWVQVVVDGGAGSMTSLRGAFGDAVLLIESGRRVAIGRFVDQRERRAFAQELKSALAASRAGASAG